MPAKELESSFEIVEMVLSLLQASKSFAFLSFSSEGARAEHGVCGVDEGARRPGPLGGQRGDGQHQAQGEGGEPDEPYLISPHLHGTRLMHLPRST